MATTPGATKDREEEVDNQVDKELEEAHKQVDGPEEAPWQERPTPGHAEADNAKGGFAFFR